MKTLKNVVIVFLAGSAFLLLTSCTDHSKPNVELIQDMMDTPALKPQRLDESNGKTRSSMRVPPENTKPVGFTPYQFAKDYDSATKNKNPMGGDLSEDVIKVGMKYYETQCAVCHGYKGEGGETNNSVGEKMNRKPPALTSDKIRSWTDGQIYHVIAVGQGMMGAYASHVPQSSRWQLVNYIRYLQKQK